MTWLDARRLRVDRRRRRVLGRRRRRPARDRGRRARGARARAARLAAGRRARSRCARAPAGSTARRSRASAAAAATPAPPGSRRTSRSRRSWRSWSGRRARERGRAAGRQARRADLVRLRRARARRTRRPRVKVGHAGTLDPFATGLLALLVGARRSSRPTSCGLDKRYRTVVQFGVRSDTGDPEGTLEPWRGPLPDARSARRGLRRGRRPDRAGAAERRRRSRSAASAPTRCPAPARPSRCRRARCTSTRSTLESYDDAAGGLAVLDVHCSKGTYIRALARDLGETLGCGAYCAELRRLAIGHLRSSAGPLDDVAADPLGGAWRCAAARRSPTCPRASSSRPSATRCCTAGRSPRSGEEGPLRCVAGAAGVRRRAARRRTTLARRGGRA